MILKDYIEHKDMKLTLYLTMKSHMHLLLYYIL